MLAEQPISVPSLLTNSFGRISLTWLLTLCETVLLAVIPLFIGLAIDGLLNKDATDLLVLGSIMLALIGVSVVRRIYDTRVYETMRVDLGRILFGRSRQNDTSTTNARLGMARELVDFLEEQVPLLMTSSVQLIVAFVILCSFSMTLGVSAILASLAVTILYGAFHGRFFRLNAELNAQMECQVGALQSGSPRAVLVHLKKLRRTNVKISDTEAFVYGGVFVILFGLLIFNLWFTATYLVVTVGTLFAIISYSWEFVEAILILPITLQSWSRLSEITKRINQFD